MKSNPQPILMTTREFENFFEVYARNVDHFYEAAYWKLCDKVIQELIRRHLNVGPGARILDAGGGTGRWALWCTRTLGVHVTIADRSQNMLTQAEHLVCNEGAEQNIRLVHCDIENAPELHNGEFDGAISIYNMLSFLDNPQQAFATLSRVLKPGARALVMGQSFANAIASKFNRDHASIEDIRLLTQTKIVKWAPHVPALRVFSSQDMKDLATRAGLSVIERFGVTTLITPGPEDFTYPYERMSQISQALEDPEYFQLALEQELALSGLPGWAERGVNLLFVIQRS